MSRVNIPSTQHHSTHYNCRPWFSFHWPTSCCFQRSLLLFEHKRLRQPKSTPWPQQQINWDVTRKLPGMCRIPTHCSRNGVSAADVVFALVSVLLRVHFLDVECSAAMQDKLVQGAISRSVRRQLHCVCVCGGGRGEALSSSWYSLANDDKCGQIKIKC